MFPHFSSSESSCLCVCLVFVLGSVQDSVQASLYEARSLPIISRHGSEVTTNHVNMVAMGTQIIQASRHVLALPLDEVRCALPVEGLAPPPCIHSRTPNPCFAELTPLPSLPFRRDAALNTHHRYYATTQPFRFSLTTAQPEFGMLSIPRPGSCCDTRMSTTCQWFGKHDTVLSCLVLSCLVLSCLCAILSYLCAVLCCPACVLWWPVLPVYAALSGLSFLVPRCLHVSPQGAVIDANHVR